MRLNQYYLVLPIVMLRQFQNAITEPENVFVHAVAGVPQFLDSEKRFIPINTFREWGLKDFENLNEEGN